MRAVHALNAWRRELACALMDVAAPLAGQLVQTLTPFLPYLVRAGEELGAEATKELKEHGGEFAQSVWAQLGPKVETRPAAQEAVADVAKQPTDQDAQAALRVQLRKLLADDPELSHALSALLEENRGPGSTTTVNVSGNRAVGIGRDVRDSTIITGDQNRTGS
jgi:hypothetical protein